MSKIILLLRVELTLTVPHCLQSEFRTSSPETFARGYETQVNADLEGFSRCSRVVIWEPPYSEYCYLHTVIRMQLVESWLLGMLPCES